MANRVIMVNAKLTFLINGKLSAHIRHFGTSYMLVNQRSVLDESSTGLRDYPGPHWRRWESQQAAGPKSNSIWNPLFIVREIPKE